MLESVELVQELERPGQLDLRRVSRPQPGLCQHQLSSKGGIVQLAPKCTPPAPPIPPSLHQVRRSRNRMPGVINWLG